MLVLAHLHRSVLTQQVHSLGHLAFKWRSSFAKALAKLSPNFREKSPNSFYKMIHIYIINTKYKYLQCNLDMCTWTFAKTLARKKFTFAISEKNFSRDCSLHTQRLAQRKPLSWTFCSTLKYIYIYTICIHKCILMYIKQIYSRENSVIGTTQMVYYCKYLSWR